MEKEDLRFLALFAVLLALVAVLGCGAPPADTAETAEAAETLEPVPGATPWPELPAPELPSERPLNVGFLIVDGVYNTELTAPYDVFQHTIYQVELGMEVFTVSPDGGPVITAEGLSINAHYGFDDAPPIDVLVVPSAEHSRDSDLENEALIAWVREIGKKARYVMSLCWGAFVLAEADLLDGHACTTFPTSHDEFAARFPSLDLRREVSFVHDGKALTSAGGAKSFDVAMYFVDHLYGEKVAQGIGGGLILPWPPRPADVPAVVIEPGAMPSGEP